MTHKLIEGIARRIGEVFPGLNVYDRDVPQNLTEPAFTVRIVDDDVKPHPAGTWQRRTLVSVNYFPADPGNLDVMNDIMSPLGRALRWVESADGTKFRSLGWTGRISDGVLVMTGTYLYYIKELGEDAPAMETLEYEPAVNE